MSIVSQSTTAPDRLSTPNQAASIRFLAIFLLLAAAFFMGDLLPESFLDSLTAGTATFAAAAGTTFGIPVTSEESFVSVSGFRMLISLECTALHYLALFWAGVIAYPLKPLGSKMRAIGLGTLAIVSMNILRILVVGEIGARFPDVFDFVHAYLWQGIFGLFVFLIWYAWMSGGALLRRERFRAAIVFLAVSALALGLLRLAMPILLSGFAAAADSAFRLIPTLQALRFFVHEGAITLYYSSRLFTYDLTADILFASLFIAFLFAAPGKATPAGVLARAAIGIACLGFLYLAILVVIGVSVPRLDGSALLDHVFWGIRGVAMAAPLVLWFLLKKEKTGKETV